MKTVFTLFASAAAVASTLRKANFAADKDGHLVSAMKFQTTLRLCNAFAYDSDISITLKGAEVATLKYKECADSQPALAVNDKLAFNAAGSTIGTFTISSLPNADATLLLLVRRHDSESTAVAFESHVFAATLSPQLAVIDTYVGDAADTLKISDAAGTRTEDLTFDTVVAVNPGDYKISTGKKAADLHAAKSTPYVVLRVGLAKDGLEGGKSFEEDVIVFPQGSNAAMVSLSAAVALALAWAM
jgi:hypothetical protein